MVAIGPDSPTPSQCSIDRLRDTDRQTLNPGSDPARIVRLDEQVNMIGLHAELQQPKAGCGRLRQSPLDYAEHGVST